MQEAIGPLTNGVELVTDAEGLRMEFRRWWLCGIPLPARLGPRVEARQWQDGDDYRFLVDISAPGIGRVVAYRGKLAPNGARGPDPVRA